MYRLHFNAYILGLLNFFEFLMMSAKFATLGLLKLKIF